MRLNTERVRSMRDYDPIIFVFIMIILVIVSIAYFFYFPPAFFAMPKTFQVPIETIPFDGGWIGFSFIFVNGFLLSYVVSLVTRFSGFGEPMDGTGKVTRYVTESQ